MGNLIVVVPCFNCEKQIVRVLDSINRKIEKMVDEVLIIENRSDRDQTLEAAFNQIQAFKNDKYTLIQNNKNIGLGGSHKVGINYALEKKYKYIAFVHGDHQTNPKELEQLYSILKEDKSLSACLGARFIRGAQLYGYNKIRLLANQVLNVIYSFICLKRTYELGAGLSVHRVEDFKDHRFQEFTDSFNFYCFMLLDYYQKNKSVKFIPISYYETDQVSNVGNFKIGILTLKCVLYWRFFGLEKFKYINKGHKRII
jgi:glycosyltransferase involved in cell wall biosynthesis